MTLVDLTQDPDGPYANSPEGWWTQYGGALNQRSGVVYIPPHRAHEVPRRIYPEAAEE
ncbi:hypothetical protein EASAB2608_01115 [Streptomyces sp. EAS-AB2608]|uniref:hypothetical protein n=1 Tax=Streptomyces sp. EAS-AB2608 TaxID=2779671 RepID=UPI001BED914F|nr:hypothetical protein [Streptomyces sp. EAS-AB2608]BCM65781.1 hypothetical protein EASAB2608_01115 [Streptomyces sp. EAS-AB2608]